MRLVEPENFFGRTEGNESFQNFPVKSRVRAGVEFSVRKGARASLAELDVPLRIQRPAARKRPDLFRALLHARPPLDELDGNAAIDEAQRAEQPRGPLPTTSTGRSGQRERGRRESGCLSSRCGRSETSSE